MIDEIYDRHYHSARRDLNDGIVSAFASLARAFRNAFEVLNRIEYSAPWTADSRKLKSH